MKIFTILLLCLSFSNALASGPKPKPPAVVPSVSSAATSAATSTANAVSSADAAPISIGGDSSRAYGLASGSPSWNACQRILFFGFSADVETCQLQQWAIILGANPAPAQLQIACKDNLLSELPMCAQYRKP